MCNPSWSLIPSLVILAGFGPGCDGRPAVDSSTTEATVTGTVLIKGKPATGGEVRFNPANVDRPVGPRSAPIGSDGTYKITTYTGGNQIGFGGSVATENPGLFRHKQYFEVKKGENQLNFDLLTDSQPVPGTTKAQQTKSQAAAGPTKSRGKMPR